MRFLLALSFAFVLAAQADDYEVRRDLEHVYSSWRGALASHDYATWQRTTASYRQAITRNMIVSQMQPFPGALFAMPMRPPDTGTLRLVKTEVKGPTAHLIYFGRVDLGISDSGEVPENLLLLRFIKETGGWKFDTTRVINLAGAADVRAQLKNSGSTSYLNDPDLRPSGIVPPTAPLCRAPDHVALLAITSYGYATAAKVNGFDLPVVTDNADQHLIIGGLSNGNNPMTLSIHPTEVPEGAQRKLLVEAMVLTGEESRPAVRVFTWQPQSEKVPAEVNLQIEITRLILKGL